MLRRQCYLLILLVLSLPQVHAVAQNPLLTEQAIYVSKNGVHRYQRDSLKLLWSSLIGVDTFAPVLAGNRILVGSSQGLYALHAQDGSILWQLEPLRTLFSPSVGDTGVFAGSRHGELYSIDARDGQILWQRQFPGWIYSPSIDAARARLWSGGQAHSLYALSIQSGELLQTLPTTQELVFSPTILQNGDIAFNLFDGSAMILDSRKQALRGRLTGSSTPLDIHSDPYYIYRSFRDGSLVAVDLHTLKPAWQRQLLPADLSMHPAAPGFLLLSDRDQQLLLYDLNQQRMRCRYQMNGIWDLPTYTVGNRIVYLTKIMNSFEPGVVVLPTKCH